MALTGIQKQDKTMDKLIYVMDPHCGWCYGNSENIKEISAYFKGKLDVELYVGGMWTGQRAPVGGASFAKFINDHSPAMEQRTGAYVSPDFYKLSQDSSYVFSSLEPSAAICLVKQMEADKVVAFASEVQKQLFAKGQRLDKLEAYLPALEKLGLDSEAFQQKWMSEENISAAQQEFATSRNYARSYPTLLLQKDGKLHSIAEGYFDPERIKQKINEVAF